MLDTRCIYKVYHLDPYTDTADYGWSPDGEGMYWYDSMEEALAAYPYEPSPHNFRIFENPRSFDDYRYGYMP